MLVWMGSVGTSEIHAGTRQILRQVMETRNPRGWVSGRKWIWFLSRLSIGRHCPWLQVVGVLIGGGRWGGGLHQWPNGAFLSPALCNGLFNLSILARA